MGMDCDDGEDFMVRKSSRRKKTNVRLHLLGDSDDSGGIILASLIATNRFYKIRS